MIFLNEHEYLHCYSIKLAAKDEAKLMSYKLAANVIHDDYKLPWRVRLQAEARLAQDYFKALESALNEAETEAEAEAEAEA